MAITRRERQPTRRRPSQRRREDCKDLTDLSRGDNPRTNSTDRRFKLKSKGGHLVGMLTMTV
jgi:hypothetical protein